MTICYAGKLQEEEKPFPPEKQIKFNFQSGWIQKVKKRYILKYRYFSGEKLDVEDASIYIQCISMCIIINNLTKKDLWNFHELGLFFGQEIDWKLCKTKLHLRN